MGKKVLITGANKGIGFETARQLAKLGFDVYLGCRDKERGAAAVKALKDAGIENVELLLIDVADINAVKSARAELESRLSHLDILINNAAITGQQPQNMSTCDMDDLRRVFATNYFGAIQTTQQFIPLMQKAQEPHIINIASEVGSLGMNTSKDRNPNWDLYNVYGSSKTAVNAFTVTLANELRNTKFCVNSVTPGYTATDLNNFKGIKTVEEGAKPIIELALQTGVNRANGRFFKDGAEVAW